MVKRLEEHQPAPTPKFTITTSQQNFCRSLKLSFNLLTAFYWLLE